MSGDKGNKAVGHRQRLRELFAASGFKGFHDYEVLEFLLTYIFRQRDVKPIAKELIKTFGSFSAVLDARAENIAKVKKWMKIPPLLFPRLGNII